MTSLKSDVDTSHAEVTNICVHGFWLMVDDREYFVPFENYPDFMTASVREIYGVQRIAPTQFHWPTLDVDIELDALEHPEAFPLRFRR